MVYRTSPPGGAEIIQDHACHLMALAIFRAILNCVMDFHSLPDSYEDLRFFSKAANLEGSTTVMVLVYESIRLKGWSICKPSRWPWPGHMHVHRNPGPIFNPLAPHEPEVVILEPSLLCPRHDVSARTYNLHNTIFVV